MASMEEIIGQLNYAIGELDRNAVGHALQSYEGLEASLHALDGVPAGDEAAQAYHGLIDALRTAQAAEQHLKQTLEQTKATFHG